MKYRYNQILSIFFVVFLLLSVCAIFVKIPQVKAYSNNVIANYSNVSTNEGTSAQLGSYTIYAVDNQILFYDSSGNLAKNYVISGMASYLTVSANNPLLVSEITKILPINSTFLLVVTSGCYLYSGSYLSGGLYSQYGLLSINSLNYTPLGSSSIADYTNMYGGSNAYGTVDNILFSETNTTASYYWLIASSSQFAVYGSNSGGLDGTIQPYHTYYSNFVYIGDIIQNQPFNYGGTVLLYSPTTVGGHTGGNCYCTDSSLWIESQTNLNQFYIITGSNSSTTFLMGNSRANIELVDTQYSTISNVGITSLDYTYTGYYYQLIGGSSGTCNFDPTMAYLMSFYYTNGLYEVNLAYSWNSPHQFGVDTIIFNSTYVGNSNIEDWSINTNSLMTYPFVCTVPSGYGSGLYTIAVWGNNPSITLDGYSFTLTGLETLNPSWSTYQGAFIFTPQQPQTFYYSSATNFLGYQQEGYGVGIESSGTQVIGQNFYNTNSILTYNGVLTGGVFNGATLNTAPVEITLEQNTQYIYTGETYISSILTGSGNYTINVSGISTSDSIFSNPSLSIGATGSISSGTFQFYLTPVSATQTVYQVIQVQYNSNNYTGTLTYNFGFYAIGGSGDTGVPYPTPYNGGSGGSGGTITGSSPISTDEFMLLLFFLIIVIPLGTWFGNYGFYFGLIFATIITYQAGFMPIWGLFLLVIGLGLLGYQTISGLIPQAGLPQIPQIPHLSNRNNTKEGSK